MHFLTTFFFLSLSLLAFIDYERNGIASSIYFSFLFVYFYHSFPLSRSFGHFESFYRNSSRISCMCDRISGILASIIRRTLFEFYLILMNAMRKRRRRKKKKKEIWAFFLLLFRSNRTLTNKCSNENSI